MIPELHGVRSFSFGIVKEKRDAPRKGRTDKDPKIPGIRLVLHGIGFSQAEFRVDLTGENGQPDPRAAAIANLKEGDEVLVVTESSEREFNGEKYTRTDVVKVTTSPDAFKYFGALLGVKVA